MSDAATMMKLDLVRTSSRETSSIHGSYVEVTYGSYAMTRRPKPWILRAILWPILPMPTKPTVLPRIRWILRMFGRL